MIYKGMEIPDSLVDKLFDVAIDVHNAKVKTFYNGWDYAINAVCDWLKSNMQHSHMLDVEGYDALWWYDMIFELQNAMKIKREEQMVGIKTGIPNNKPRIMVNIPKKGGEA